MVVYARAYGIFFTVLALARQKAFQEARASLHGFSLVNFHQICIEQRANSQDFV